ncbi:MAG: zf-HC2 domain-containing protein [Actinomycetota bacterium]|nr:zf-HC2 domain-containing protein [Actinomycetota bacterium]
MSSFDPLADDIDRRLAANFEIIMGEIAAPARSRFERVLLALRVPEPTARLVAATPVLRWAWTAAVAVVLLFAAVAGDGTWQAGDQLAVFLALAPVVPVVGVALAYGPSADRGHEVTVAAPMSGLRLLLLRTATVLVAAGGLSLLTVIAAPTKGWMRLAWLAPGLATTLLTLALATRLGVRRAAGAVAGAWLVLVIVVAQATDDATAPFRVVGQVGSLLVAAVAGAVMIAGRRRLDRWSDA